LAKHKDRVRFFLGDIRDRDRLNRAFHRVDYVIHTAALKHVNILEYNPSEAIATNIIGTQNVVDAAIDQRVEKLLLISTDKSANPTSLYGATKLCAEKITVGGNFYGSPNTKLSAIRFGNIFGSRGSFVELIKRQRQTGVVQLTHEQMSRFWISVAQTTGFILEALGEMRGGEIFVPRIPSMKIVDLAKAIDPDCRQEVVGIRPGEKVHETLLSEDEARNTVQYKECFIVQHNHRLRDSMFEHVHLGKNNGHACPEGFRYTSDSNTEWLQVDDLKQLVDRISDDYAIEHSRWSMQDVPE